MHLNIDGQVEKLDLGNHLTKCYSVKSMDNWFGRIYHKKFPNGEVNIRAEIHANSPTKQDMAGIRDVFDELSQTLDGSIARVATERSNLPMLESKVTGMNNQLQEFKREVCSAVGKLNDKVSTLPQLQVYGRMSKLIEETLSKVNELSNANSSKFDELTAILNEMEALFATKGLEIEQLKALALKLTELYAKSFEKIDALTGALHSSDQKPNPHASDEPQALGRLYE